MVRTLISLFAFLLSMSAFSANIPQAASIFQGGHKVNSDSSSITVPISSGSNLFTIGVSGSTPGPVNFYPLIKLGAPGSQAQYKVSSTKTLRCATVRIGSSAASNGYLFGYGTAALIAYPTTTAPTGAVYYGDATAASVDAIFRVTTAGTSEYLSIPAVMSFPPDSYPFVRIGATGAEFSVLLDCYEQ